MPRVSVVIPTFNRGGTILRAIDSVLQQTYRDIEIIVCDDGSTDNTVEVVRSLQKKYEIPIHLEILTRNYGSSAARNRAVFVAGGELIAFLDSDDAWTHDKLAKQVDFIDSNPGHIGVGCNIDVIVEGGSKIEESLVVPNHFLNENEELFMLINSCYITTSCFLVKKDALVLAGLFDIRLRSSEDRDLWWRLPRIGRVGFINEVLTIYYSHNSRVSSVCCKTTEKTYIPSIMKTIWFWRDRLTKEQSRRIWSSARMLIASDALIGEMPLTSIKNVVIAIVYGCSKAKAFYLIASACKSILKKTR